MSRPLHRGVLAGGRLSGNIQDYLEESQMKVKADGEDFEKSSKTSSDHVSLTLRNPFQFLFSEISSSLQDAIENKFVASDPLSPTTLRNRHMLTLLFLKFSLVVIVILGLTMSFLWTISLTTASRGHMVRGYRRLQAQLVSDLWDIGELSLGATRFKESDFCSLEFEHYVPCFNITENLEFGFTEGKEYDRHCGPMSRQNCLILAPPKYKIPHRWPTGREVIWIDNVKITAQEVLSSGSLTKRSINSL